MGSDATKKFRANVKIKYFRCIANLAVDFGRLGRAKFIKI